jgi:hypothetical protein
MQSHIIMAFRKRLKKRGYNEIKIKKVYPEKILGWGYLYTVSVVEPLAKTKITVDYTLNGMDMSFKHPDYVGYPFGG